MVIMIDCNMLVYTCHFVGNDAVKPVCNDHLYNKIDYL